MAALAIVVLLARTDQRAAGLQPDITDETFDQWVFRQDRTASIARKRLETELSLHVEAIDRACKLTDAQKQRLQLAGRGDIKRFFDAYENVKRKFQLIKHDQDRVNNEIWQEISPLQISIQSGLFHEGSLLYKSLHHALSAEQIPLREALVREQRAFRHRANVELVIVMLEQAMPLRAAQRQELIAVMTKETKPPRAAGRYDYYVMMYQLGRLPEEKLKPLFDDVQWRILSAQIAQYKGFEANLRAWGQWPIDGDEAEEVKQPPPRAGGVKKRKL